MKIDANSIIAFLAETPHMCRDRYRDLELKVTTSNGDVTISGVFGERGLASIVPTWRWGTMR